jgi:hypothetical protein
MQNNIQKQRAPLSYRMSSYALHDVHTAPKRKVAYFYDGESNCMCYETGCAALAASASEDHYTHICSSSCELEGNGNARHGLTWPHSMFHAYANLCIKKGCIACLFFSLFMLELLTCSPNISVVLTNPPAQPRSATTITGLLTR